MARRRDGGPLVVDRADEYPQIIDYYRHLLETTQPPAGLKWEPVRIGPTWDWEPDRGWLLPEHTLGWDVLAWSGTWLRAKDGSGWDYTPEQARFILWYYAIEESGEFTYHSAALQRLKGWGKDPLAACIAMVEMVGPAKFSHWDDERPIGRDDPNAWIQIAAVSQEQTKNTMKLLPGLVPQETRDYYGIQMGKLNAWAMGDTRQIEAVTQSPLALEGGRPTQVIRGETQNWNSSNSGHDMAGVIDGNAAKRDAGSPARILDIFNAYRPGEDSVAERVRDAWESTQGDRDADDDEDRPSFVDFGLLYDSLEAPPEAPLRLDEVPAVLEAVRGDADWLQADRIRKSIADPRNPPSESRRKWFNQITGVEDAWQTPQTWDVLARPDVVVEPHEEVVLFLDCSLSDDATALVGCRISDGHVFTLGMWQRPARLKDAERRAWQVPREKVDAAVQSARDRFTVVAFFGDPSHAVDQETQTRYWDGLFDKWHREMRHELRLWATEGRDRGHAVMFDMALRRNQDAFVDAVAVAEADIEARAFSHDADPRMRQHVINARRTPTKAGMSIAKEHRESRKKVDLAVCMVGARMVRRIYLNTRRSTDGGWVL